jgi:hypothetical protein
MPYADAKKQAKYRADRYRSIYQSDEEFRAAEAARKAEWFTQRQDARERMKQRYRERYATDPAFRAKEQERAREKYLKKKGGGQKKPIAKSPKNKKPKP